MKIMKSYRMDDTILGMLDRIKKIRGIENDTAAINFCILRTYYNICPKDEDLPYRS